MSVRSIMAKVGQFSKSGRQKTRQKTLARRPMVEPLEDRLLLTAKLFLDFGDAFPSGVMPMTVRELRDTLQGPDLNKNGGLADSEKLKFTSLASLVSLYKFDYNQDGATNADDASQLRRDIVSLVERYYAPFDVQVVTHAASSLKDVTDALGIKSEVPAGDYSQEPYSQEPFYKPYPIRDGEWQPASPDTHDAYVFVAGITRSNGAAAITLGGLAALEDVRDGANLRDDTAIVLVNNIFAAGWTNTSAAVVLANASTHEAGHNFGLRHADGARDPSATDRKTLVWCELMAERVPSDLVFFSRFRLESSDAGGFQNSYDQLVQDPYVGRRNGGPAYVTGTGAHDRITLTRRSATEVDVTVEAFRDPAFTTPIQVPSSAWPKVTSYTYTLGPADGLDNSILVEAGTGYDRIVVDANIGRQITVRGMGGNDELFVIGNGVAEARYLPDAGGDTRLDGSPSYQGTIVAGQTTVHYEEFEPQGAVAIKDIPQVTLVAPYTANVLTVESPGPTWNRVTGTSRSFDLVPFSTLNVANLILDTATNTDPDAPEDIITVQSTAAGSTVTVQAGDGADTIKVGHQLYGLDFIGGTLDLRGGEDADKLEISDWALYATAHIYQVSPNQVARSGGLQINYDSFANVTVLGSNQGDAFFISNPAAGTELTIHGASGNDGFFVTEDISSSVKILGEWDSDVVVGPNGHNVWNINGSNEGTLNQNVAFANVENLIGGPATDWFVFKNGQGVAGIIDGGPGSDRLDYADYTSDIQVNLATRAATGVAGEVRLIEEVIGGAGNDSLTVPDYHTDSVVYFNGNSGSDTLIGPNKGLYFTDNGWNVWDITGRNQGKLNDQVTFSSVENLKDGFASDVYLFRNGASISGAITGGGGADTLDFWPYQTGVYVNLATGRATTMAGDPLVGAIVNIPHVSGTFNDDIIIGSDAANILVGYGGNDVLIGGKGLDYLYGGEGDDLLIGSSIADLPDDTLRAIAASWASSKQKDRRLIVIDDTLADALDGGPGSNLVLQ